MTIMPTRMHTYKFIGTWFNSSTGSCSKSALNAMMVLCQAFKCGFDTIAANEGFSISQDNWLNWLTIYNHVFEILQKITRILV